MAQDRFDPLFVQPGAYDASLVLAEAHAAAEYGHSHGIDGTRPTLHLAVDDVGARHAELKSVALFAPEATHWGTRWFVARDPDGDPIAFEERPSS